MINIKGRTIKGPYVVTSGLVLYLDAGNTRSYPGSGTTWYDISGSGNNFTFSTTPTFSNGIFDSLGTTYAYRSAISNDSSVNGYTLEAYFKINTSLNSSWQNILQNGNDPSRHMMWYNGGSNTFQALFHVPNSYNNISDAVIIDKWYHLQLSYNPAGGGSNGRRAWINGIEKTVNNTAAGNTNPSGNFTIAVDSDLTTNKSDISYSFIRYYKRYLSQDEIIQNFNATKSKYDLS